MPPTASNLSVALANVHSDNFGDHLNAQAALHFFEDRLGATVTHALYAGTGWDAKVPLPAHVHHHVVGRAFDDPVDDVLQHHFGFGHACPNAEIWDVHHRVLDGVDLIVSVPSGEAIGLYRDLRFLVPFVAATAARTRSMMFYGTTHRSGSQVFDDLAHLALGDTHVRVRDRSSLATLHDQGLFGFGGLDPTFLEAAHRADRVSGPRRPVVTAVLGDTMAWHPSAPHLERGIDGPSARELVVNAITQLDLSEGVSIELVPHSPLASELDVLEEAARTIGRRQHVVVRRDITSVDGYIDAIATSASVVSLRYHGAVVALAVGTPVLAIAYEEKTVGLMKWAGSPHTCLHLDDLRTEQLADALSSLVRGEAGELGADRLAVLRHEIEADLLELERALVTAPRGTDQQLLPTLCDDPTRQRLVRRHLGYSLQRSHQLATERDAGLEREASARRHIAAVEDGRERARTAQIEGSNREIAAGQRIAELEADVERLRAASNSTQPVHNL